MELRSSRTIRRFICQYRLGQQAPLEDKARWDPDFTKRKKNKATLSALIPEFAVNLGGTTSIDVTKPGIDKAYGIRKLRDTLGVAISNMIFVSDAIFPGGNDYPAIQAGALSICVRDPEETKRITEAILACLKDVPTANTNESSRRARLVVADVRCLWQHD